MSKRKCLTIKEKNLILQEVDRGVKKKDIASKFGIPSSSLSTIIRNRDKIENNDLPNPCSKRLKTCVYEDVNEAVLKWIHAMRDKNVPISGPLITEKAMQFAKALGHDEFRGSSGWLDKFKRKQGIVGKVMSGESNDVSDKDCESWIAETLNKILKDYKPENIFNADETALFFQCLPQKTLTFKNEKCFGGKHSKARITIMLGANMTGNQKLKPLIIGKSKTPRCFKGTKSLEVDYEFNKKSWMTADICEKWIQKLDKLMIAEHRKIALIFDNCPAHPKDINKKLKNITVFYLPPNTTSKLQPMDRGVIQNFKLHYRKRMVRKVIAALENKQSMPKINLRESITELSKAWNSDVTDRTIRNSFAKGGYCEEDEEDEDGNDEEVSKPSYDEMLKSFETIRRGLQFEENTPEGIFGALQKCKTYYEKKHFYKPCPMDVSAPT
nr:tigger transposable element-derived protein 4-like [Parasteatoda tepidariorum]